MKLVHFLFFLVFYTGVEFVTEGAWRYHPDFEASVLTFRHQDVNVIVALGWVSMLGLGLSLGAFAATKLSGVGASFPKALIDTIAVGVVGIATELVSMEWGMFSYVRSHPLITLGFREGIWIGPLPLTVVAGYFLTGWFAHSMVKLLR
jgi:hypothetical protein